MPLLRAVLLAVFIPTSLALAAPTAWLLAALGVSTDLIPLTFCQIVLGLLGVRVRVTGRPGPTARLVVANHVSWIDVLALGSVEPLCFVAKHEVAAWPLLGAIAKRQGTIFMDRGRRRMIPAVNALMADRLRDDRNVLLFPEGTTHDGTRLGVFRTGHLACLRDCLRRNPGIVACQVQTIAIAYDDPMAAWVGDATLLPHLWAVLKRPGLTCHLGYGELLAVERGEDRKELGRTLAASVASVLGVPWEAGGRAAKSLRGFHKLVASSR